VSRRILARSRGGAFALGKSTNPSNQSSSIGGSSRSIVAYNDASSVNGVITECKAFFGASDNAAFLTISPAGLIRDIGSTFATTANTLVTRSESLDIQVGDFLGVWLENGQFVDIALGVSGKDYYYRSISGSEAKPSIGDTRAISIGPPDSEVQLKGTGVF
jgi:hypothetical protein